MDAEKQVFGSHDLTEILIGFLRTQASRVNQLPFDNFSDRSEDLMPLLAGATETALSIADLATESRLNECTMLARAFIERAINYCYLSVCDETELEKFQQYNIQKTFRQTARKFISGTITIATNLNGTESVNLFPELKKALDEFTSENDREKTRWTKKTIVERLTAISESNRVNVLSLVFTVFIVYEDASEVLHGTGYGCTFHLGLHDPNIRSGGKSKIIQNIEMNLTLLLWGCSQVLHQLLILLGSQHDISKVVEDSSREIESVFKIMKLVSK